MSNIWGNTYGKIINGSTEITLIYSVVAVNFMIPANIMHQSVISATGHRSWSRKEKYVEFTHSEYLFLYNNPIVKANQILNCENLVIQYEFMNGGMIQDMYVEKVDIQPLTKDNITYEYGIAIIYLKNINYLVISRRIKEKPGQKWIKAKGGTADGKILRTRGIII